MKPDPFLLEIDAEAADSVVGRAEKIRDHLAAAIAMANGMSGATDSAEVRLQAECVAAELQALLSDEVAPLIHAAEDAAAEAQVAVERAYGHPAERRI